eukprot:scaffold21298_cov169-Skeletonema_dohrnii-CCMP3373.AAC.1
MECKKHRRQFQEISVLATTTKMNYPSRLCIPITGLGCPQRSKVTSSGHWKKQRRNRIRSLTRLIFLQWTTQSRSGECPFLISLAILHHFIASDES